VKSFAASQQEFSLLVAQPERPEQGPVKIESASEGNTHQAADSRYVQECSLPESSM
jgi:hypothetical protein